MQVSVIDMNFPGAWVSVRQNMFSLLYLRIVPLKSDHIKEALLYVILQARKAGGLRVICTSLGPSWRILDQFRGRSGRQGDPGESFVILNLNQDILRTSPVKSKQLKKIESRKSSKYICVSAFNCTCVERAHRLAFAQICYFELGKTSLILMHKTIDCPITSDSLYQRMRVFTK